MKKVVLIRLDKIGDLISTLAVDQAPFLTEADGPCEVRWVVAKGLGFVPANSDPQRKFIELDKSEAWGSFLKLLKFLRFESPDVAVSFQAPWWVSLALLLSGVPTRAGVQSQWHSFLFLNKTLRQKRSEARQHEADYNADLLAHAFGQKSYPSPVLHLKSPIHLDLSTFSLEKNKFIIVHPGMAGSALNWPVNKYVDLISFLIKDQKVVLTGTAGDEKWLSEIKKTFAGNPQVVNLQSRLSSEELMSLISQAKAVVCPSTGVAHIAASLGTPVVGLYSPIGVQHPRRWAARGDHVEILVPDLDCPERFHCQGEACRNFFCMDKISVQSVLDKVRELT